MSKLGLNQELIDKARNSAHKVALDVQAFIDEHTTVAVEKLFAVFLASMA
ncbi:MAG: lysine 5,6-aminomutase subunit alpha [Eubacterium sp.]